MFESTGILPEGFYGSPNLHVNGLFDECINVEADWTDTSFKCKDCTVFICSEMVTLDELANEVAENQRSNWLSIFEALVLLSNGLKLKQPEVRDNDRNSGNLPIVDFCISPSCSMEDLRYAAARLIGSRAIDNFTDKGGNNYFTSIMAITMMIII